MRVKLDQQEEDIKDYYLKCTNAEELVQQLTKKLELHDTVRDLTKELRLKVAILGRFIPPKEFHRIKERAQYDEVVDEWHIPKVLLAGNTIRAGSNGKNASRPISAP